MKKNNKDDQLESKWEVFLRNYHTVPGFKALIKLGGYFLFFLLFILVVTLGTKNDDKEITKEEETPTKEVSTKKYKDILSELGTIDKSIKITYDNNNELVVIDALLNNGIITGTIDSINGTKRFKIENNKIYEVLLDNDTLNDKLFNGINIDYVIPSNISNILTNSQATKRIEGNSILYNYNIDGIEYIVEVNNESIKNININNKTWNYKVEYK